MRDGSYTYQGYKEKKLKDFSHFKIIVMAGFET